MRLRVRDLCSGSSGLMGCNRNRSGSQLIEMRTGESEDPSCTGKFLKQGPALRTIFRSWTRYRSKLPPTRCITISELLPTFSPESPCQPASETCLALETEDAPSTRNTKPTNNKTGRLQSVAHSVACQQTRRAVPGWVGIIRNMMCYLYPIY